MVEFNSFSAGSSSAHPRLMGRRGLLQPPADALGRDASWGRLRSTTERLQRGSSSRMNVCQRGNPTPQLARWCFARDVRPSEVVRPRTTRSPGDVDQTVTSRDVPRGRHRDRCIRSGQLRASTWKTGQRSVASGDRQNSASLEVASRPCVSTKSMMRSPSPRRRAPPRSR